MCGISGIYSKRLDEKNRSTQLDTCLRLHSHRGPDAAGQYDNSDLHLSVGMTRLAITDTENGNQPFTSEDGSKMLFFNGEIFNFRELRSDLEKKGAVFRTDCDTEVLLYGFEYGGDDFLRTINGFFAFCFIDIRKKTITIARDGFGVKPLFFSNNSDGFIFSSELRAVLEAQKQRQVLNYDSLAEYLRVGFVSAPKTMFTGIEQLTPGELMELDLLSGEIVRKSKWFDLVDFFNSAKYGPKSKKTIRSLVQEAVENRFQSVDEQACLMLSGGVDSNVIRSTFEDKVAKNYTARFLEEKNSEVDRLKDIKGDIFEIGLSFEACVDFLPECVEALEMPLNDTAIIPTFALSKEISKNSKIAFSGLGADEFFLGYARHSDGLSVERLLRKFVPKSVFRILGNFEGRIAKRIAWNAKNNWSRYIEKITVYSDWETEQLLGRKSNPTPEPTSIARLPAHFDTREIMGLYDAAYYLPNNILYLSDKMSMAHSVEIREPFLDQKLVSSVLALDIGEKLPVFPKRRFKKALKKAFGDQLSKSIASGKKKGFAGPTEVWWANGQLQKYAHDILSKSKLGENGIISSSHLGQIVSRNFEEMSPNKVIALLLLELWFRKFSKYVQV